MAAPPRGIVLAAGNVATVWRMRLIKGAFIMIDNELGGGCDVDAEIIGEDLSFWRR